MSIDISKPQTFMRQPDYHARLHAKCLDRDLGFNIPKIENNLLKKYRAYDKCEDDSNKKKHFPDCQAWVGLHPQALQTTYNDIFDALSLIKDYDIQHIVDIGAGYGRVGLVMNALIPDCSFTGLEIVESRQKEGCRIFEKYSMNNCVIHNVNVLNDSYTLPDADVYFIYDFSEIRDISRVLKVLSQRLMKKKFFLIVHGDRVEYLIDRKFKEFWIANGHISCGDLKIYSSNIDLNRRKNYGNR